MTHDVCPWRRRPAWSDLTSDLLSTIYLGCTSAYDRARFAAVCTSWRAVAGWHRRLPALPLLLPTNDGVRRDLKSWTYSPEDGRALHRVPLRLLTQGHRLVGSYDGGWVATVSSDNQICVVNLFTGALAPLSAKQRYIVCSCPLPLKRCDMPNIQKVLFSDDPTSGSCILVAMNMRRTIALCKVGCPDGGWTTHACGKKMYRVLDIAFCRGELYGFTTIQLFKFNISMDKHGAPVANPVQQVDIKMGLLHVFGDAMYIFELHGRIAIAVKANPERGLPKQMFFKVFDLAEGETMWKEVTTLGDHALFLGRASKVVNVSRAAKRGEVKGNHIYYAENESYVHNYVECLPKLDIGNCELSCWERKDIHYYEKILSRGYCCVEGGNGYISCMWLWPPEF